MTDSQVLIATDFAPNGSLLAFHQFTQTGFPPEWSDTTSVIILYGVAKGLEYLNSESRFHGNLHLGNILLDENYEPHLTDYCLLELFPLRLKSDSRIDRNAFCNPESASSATETIESDIFAFGILLYVLRAQRRPYSNAICRNLLSLGNAILRKNLRPDVSSFDLATQQFLKECWDADPKRRPTIQQVISFLDGHVTTSGFPNASEADVGLYVRRISGKLTAIDHLNALARTGDARAMFYLAWSYERGDVGLALDLEQALRWFRDAADAGDRLAQTRFAMLVGDPDIAEQYYALAAAQGDADAMNNLACLIEGRDLARARQLYAAASQAGHATATLNLGRLQEAEGNAKEALASYTEAVSQGSTEAPIFVARLAQNEELLQENGDHLCLGMIRYQQCDFVQAAAHFRLAGDANPVALFNLGCLVQKGFAEGNAMELFARASSKGHFGAQNNLAILLAETEPESAKAFLGEAAKNCPQAANNLGILVESSDPARAARAFKEAADAGLPEAMENYADVVEQGKGVEGDRNVALDYYRRAVDAGAGRLTASVIALKRLQG